MRTSRTELYANCNQEESESNELPSDSDEEDMFESILPTRESRRTAENKEIVPETHVVNSTQEFEAIRSSWARLVTESDKMQQISANQFENMQRLSERTISKKSSLLSHYYESLNATILDKQAITILVADMDLNAQASIQPEIPLVTFSNGEAGYDLDAMVQIALDVYDLDPKFVQVDFWDDSLQTFILSDDLYANERNSNDSIIRIIT